MFGLFTDVSVVFCGPESTSIATSPIFLRKVEAESQQMIAISFRKLENLTGKDQALKKN